MKVRGDRDDGGVARICFVDASIAGTMVLLTLACTPTAADAPPVGRGEAAPASAAPSGADTKRSDERPATGADEQADAPVTNAAPPPAEPDVATPTPAPTEDLTKYPLDRIIPFPATPIAATTSTLSWTKVGELPCAWELHLLDRGVIGRCGEQTYGITPEGTPGPITVELPRESIFGSYPDDAWYIWLHPHDSSQETFQLRRLRGNGKWVAQDMGGERERPDLTGVMLARGGRGGRLVATQRDKSIELVRVAPAGADDPPMQHLLEGNADAVVETRSGRIYTFVDIQREDRRSYTVVQRDCEEAGCQREDVMTFPSPDGFESNWHMSKTVLRQRHSMSMIGSESRRPAGDSSNVTGHQWLVHYGAEGWQIEQLPADHRAELLWAHGDGGLLVAVSTPEGKALWRRDLPSSWSAYTMPEGIDASTLQIAFPDADRVWVAAASGASTSVWEAVLTPEVAPADTEAGAAKTEALPETDAPPAAGVTEHSAEGRAEIP